MENKPAGCWFRTLQIERLVARVEWKNFRMGCDEIEDHVLRSFDIVSSHRDRLDDDGRFTRLEKFYASKGWQGKNHCGDAHDRNEAELFHRSSFF